MLITQRRGSTESLAGAPAQAMPKLSAIRRRGVDESAIAAVALASAQAGSKGGPLMMKASSNPILEAMRANAASNPAAAAAAADAIHAEKLAAAQSRGRRQSLVDRLRETRDLGESKTMLCNEMQGASREDLEFTIQMNEREHLDNASEMKRLQAENKTLRERTWKMTVLVESIQQGNNDAYKELAELRTYKEEREARDLENEMMGPGDLQWMKLKKLKAEVDQKYTDIKAQLRLRTAEMDEKQAEMAQLQQEMGKREADAEAKTAAAVSAMETAMEATASAEAAAKEAARNRDRDRHLFALCAVARDRQSIRMQRLDEGGYMWWERATDSLESQHAHMEDESGLALALDVSFLIGGVLGGGSGTTNQSHLESHLPARLRKSAEGRAMEPIVVGRAPRGLAWLQGLVAEVCADKLLHDRAAERLGEPLVPLAPFLLQWATGRFGMPQTCMLTLWTLQQALVAHRPSSIEAATFILFLELPETARTLRALSFYLHARAHTAGDVNKLQQPHHPPSQPSAKSLSSSASAAAVVKGRAASASAAPTAVSASSSSATAAPASPSAGSPRRGGGSPLARDLSPGRNGTQSAGSLSVPGTLMSPRRAATDSEAAADKDKGSSSSSSGSGHHEPPRRVILLSRAWEAVHHLFAPAPSHIRLAVLRELQAAATPMVSDVPPPLRSVNPMEHHVVEYELFLLACVAFFDLASHMAPAAQHAAKQAQKRRAAGAGGGGGGGGGGGSAAVSLTGGNLADTPMATALLATLRRSMIMSAPSEQDRAELQQARRASVAGNRPRFNV